MDSQPQEHLHVTNVMRDALVIEVEPGHCACGCGQRTSIATRTDRARGVMAGQPRRFVAGHYRDMSRPLFRVEDRGYKTPCHIWARAAKQPGGYGIIVVKRKHLPAHRYFYELKYGPVDPSLDMDHLCRVHECVNADHVEPVTRAVNARRGDRTKLTEGEVREIRQMTTTAAARKFGISTRHASGIRRRESWRDVA